jgi:microcin C transport system substrate-binding protein
MTPLRFYLIIITASFMIIGCGEKKKKVHTQFDTVEIVNQSNNSLNDSAKSGGLGFEKYADNDGWVTNNNITITGDPKAIKGDTITIVADDVFPPNFRGFGKDSRTQLNSLLEGMVYEYLVGLDAETMQQYPILATHWKISDDSLTFSYRIDPRARWSDGREVTSKDVVASFKILTDEGHGDPNVYTWWDEKFEVPIAESKYIVSVKCKKKEWRLLYGFPGLVIYPSYYLEKITGSSYIEKYQFEMMPGSGPYVLNTEQTTQENNGLVVLDRRTDYWANNHKRNTGLNNFDKIEFIFIADETQMVERFFAGDFDLFLVSRAQWWSQKFIASEYSEIEKGHVQRKKFINFKPTGVGGIAFNTSEPPFDRLNTRKAFSHLWDIDKLIDKLFFYEYVKTNSWFPRSKYENPNNPKQYFDPELAVKLLAQDGWSRKDGDKWMTNKDGEIFEVKEFFIYPNWDRIFNPFIEDLEQIGIKVNLVEIQNPFEKSMKKKFKFQYGGWTGSLLPSPEGMLHSKFADKIDVTNITSMNNEQIDTLIERYNRCWDSEERIKILQELDYIASNEYHWIFGWAAPYGYRCLHWNKFSMPKNSLGYSGDWRTPLSLWWIDPEKKLSLKSAILKDTNLKINPEIIDFYNSLAK